MNRYEIGTVDANGNFAPDTIGNDPELTTFAILHDAIEELHECIRASQATDDPLTRAAVLDAESNRIVWRQEVSA